LCGCTFLLPEWHTFCCAAGVPEDQHHARCPVDEPDITPTSTVPVFTSAFRPVSGDFARNHTSLGSPFRHRIIRHLQAEVVSNEPRASRCDTFRRKRRAANAILLRRRASHLTVASALRYVASFLTAAKSSARADMGSKTTLGNLAAYLRLHSGLRPSLDSRPASMQDVAHVDSEDLCHKVSSRP